MKKTSRPLKATNEGSVVIGNAILKVAVLEDGTRIISQSTIYLKQILCRQQK